MAKKHNWYKLTNLIFKVAVEIMRNKSIMQGFVYKKWIAVAEGERTLTGSRTLLCKCIACGKTKIIRVKDLGTGEVADCKCSGTIPAILPKNKGYACVSRIKSCIRNAKGYCCFYCDKKYECVDACHNRPDKCSSFWI